MHILHHRTLIVLRQSYKLLLVFREQIILPQPSNDDRRMHSRSQPHANVAFHHTYPPTLLNSPAEICLPSSRAPPQTRSTRQKRTILRALELLCLSACLGPRVGHRRSDRDKVYQDVGRAIVQLPDVRRYCDITSFGGSTVMWRAHMKLSACRATYSPLKASASHACCDSPMRKQQKVDMKKTESRPRVSKTIDTTVHAGGWLTDSFVKRHAERVAIYLEGIEQKASLMSAYTGMNSEQPLHPCTTPSISRCHTSGIKITTQARR